MKIFPYRFSIFSIILASSFCLAQTNYPYLLENQSSGEIVRRAVADSRGIPSSALILRPNTRYRLWMLEAATLRVGRIAFLTPGNGANFVIPTVTFQNAISADSDGDGLHDEAELIIGTSPIIPDTDMDGINDGPEFAQGLNPLDGLAALTGIVANVDTNGEAIHIHAFNDLAILAERDRGITVFNVFNAMAPVIIAQVDTPGEALAVHYSGRYVAVADGEAGLAVIDIDDPPAARIIHQIPQTVLGGSARAVVTTAGVAYVGLSSGRVAKVDLPSGTLLNQLTLGGNIQDMALGRDYLYVLVSGSLHTISIGNGDFQRLGAISSPGNIGAGQRRQRLFVGSSVLYATHTSGYNTFSLTNPASPGMITQGTTPQQGWKRIVTNGNGLGVAAVSPNSTNDGPHHISTYDTSDPSQINNFLTTYETPGLAADVVIYNGLAYVADSNAGLQVINYQPFDTLGIPPSITLDLDWGSSGAEEGKLVRVNANVTDDVQVRNVEFYIDGNKAVTDGNFPFEFRFTTPRLQGRTGFTLRARASDTGGNATWTDELEVALVPDGTPPRVAGLSPNNGAALGGISAIAAFFSEPIDEATITPTSFFLKEAGGDGEFDTADDLLIAGTLEWREDLLGAFLLLDSRLTAGFYRANATTNLTDLAGNQLFQPALWAFRVYNVGDDRDGDGVPDVLEPVLGLDPDNPDTNGDGIFDGDEDFDGDGLSNLVEVLFGTDPTNPDTDGDGISDANEDNDGDGLKDVDEILTYGTDPNLVDTDGDGFGDRDEVMEGSNPLDAESLPPSLFSGMIFGFSLNNLSSKENTQITLQNLASPEGTLITLQNLAYPQQLSIQNSAGPGVTEKKVISPSVAIENQE